MPLDQLGYAGGLLDRSANHRADADWLQRHRDSVGSRYVYITADKTIIRNGQLHYGDKPGIGEPVLLGLDAKGEAVFAARTDAVEDLVDLRSIAVQSLVPQAELALLAQARSLLLWHDTHGFCAKCGAATKQHDAGYRRHCDACGADHFPRTDPVIIIIGRHRGRCLLGRQSFWNKGMYSALAGFMEPGETIEEAARREVQEESGIRLGGIRYVASQPWPFPSSLMIGLIGEAETERIEIDRKELEDARWFERDELIAMVEGRHPDGLCVPPRMAIANHLIREALREGATGPE